jgi:hypothetical protein
MFKRFRAALFLVVGICWNMLWTILIYILLLLYTIVQIPIFIFSQKSFDTFIDFINNYKKERWK